MKKLLKWLFIIFIVIPLVFAVISAFFGKKDKAEVDVEQPKKIKVEASDIKSKIAKDAYVDINQKSYPKTYKKWGKKGIDKINSLGPKAAELVAKSRSCDRVEMVELSDAKSIPHKKIVFFVDCKNKERFYVSDADIELGYKVVSVRESFDNIDKSSYYEACLKGIKSQANYPSTVDTSIFNRSIRPSSTGGVLVYMEFSAKNGFGLEQKLIAECSWNNGKSDIKIYEKR